MSMGSLKVILIKEGSKIGQDNWNLTISAI